MMKKLVLLAAAASGVVFVLKRNKDAQAEADLWREATAPADIGNVATSSNGSSPADTAAQTPASEN